MAETNYIITNTDGTKKYTIDEKSIDAETLSIILIGKNSPNYGDPQNTNFLRLMENFASANEPNNPVEGQIWYAKNPDNGTYTLKVRNSESEWDNIAQLYKGNERPVSPEEGAIWFDTNGNELYIYNGNEWISVGPNDYNHIKSQSNNDLVLKSFDGTNAVYDATFQIDSSYINLDLQNDSEVENEARGCSSLITTKVVAKEVFPTSTILPRTKAWYLKYLVYSDGKTCRVVGAPAVEVIAQQDCEELNLSANDWSVEIYPKDGQKGNTVSVHFDCGSDGIPTSINAHIVVEVKSDIVRV